MIDETTPADSPRPPSDSASRRYLGADRSASLRRHARTVLIGAGSLALLGLGFSAVPPIKAGSATDTVLDYLNAARDGDVDRALEAAGRAPVGESARFLVPPAMTRDWDISSVETANTADEVTDVVVTISSEGEDATGTFSVVERVDGWHIKDPFVEVAFAKSPLWYAAVGGVTAPLAEGAVNQEYTLLPGAYEFYAASPGMVEAAPVTKLLMPDTAVRVDPGQVELTEAGQDAARVAIEDFIDQCAKDADEFWVNGCPFSTTGTVYGRTEYQFWEDPTDIAWEVEEYPQVEVSAGVDAFVVAEVQAGAITVSGSATEEVWRDHEIVTAGQIEFSVSCQIQARWLHLGLTESGIFEVAHLAGPGDRELPVGDFPASSIDTCR